MKTNIKSCAAVGTLLALHLSLAIAAEPVTIGLALASDTNPFYLTMKKGVEDRAAELGWKVVTVTANEVAAAQANGVNDLVARRVNGILVSPIDKVAINGAYDAAAKAQIPIISIARHATSPSQTAYIAMDENKIGRDIASWMAKALDEKGTVAMIAGPAGAATFRNINEGFESALKAHKKMSVVYKKESQLTRESGLHDAEDVLVSHPDVSAIYCSNDEVALGASQAVATAGKTGKILVTGMNGVPAALRSIRTGRISMTVFLNPYEWGRLGVDTLAGVLKGEKPSSEVKSKHILADKSNLDAVLTMK